MPLASMALALYPLVPWEAKRHPLVPKQFDIQSAGGGNPGECTSKLLPLGNLAERSPSVAARTGAGA